MVFFGQSNTALPQNSNDSHWDACEFAPKCPEASIGFTDMTVALVQYEIAIVSRAVLQNILEHGHAGPYLHFDEQLLLRARERIEETYLKHLDTTKPKERLVQHITSLAFERLFFAAYQPLFKLEKGGARATSALQDE